MNIHRMNVGTAGALSLLLVSVAGADNITATTARTISINSMAQNTVSDTRTEVWYRVRLFANRSYQISAWPVDHEQGVAAPQMFVSLFSDDAGTVAATPAPIFTSAALEGSPNANGDGLPGTLIFQPDTTAVYKIKVQGLMGAVSASVNVLVRETTLFSPWTSKAAGFEGFMEIHNNTSDAVNVTLKAYNSAGVLQGAGVTFSVPANATQFKTATQVGVPVGIFAGIVLTHDGAFGAIAGNITTLNGANGLSFDSPFTARDGGLHSAPVR